MNTCAVAVVADTRARVSLELLYTTRPPVHTDTRTRTHTCSTSSRVSPGVNWLASEPCTASGSQGHVVTAVRPWSASTCSVIQQPRGTCVVES